jgi:predicted homoserine dehydrogenase-like protein
MAKKDLNPGDVIDGIGGYTVYGSIDTYEQALKENALPLGLAAGAKLIKPVKKGSLITKDMVEMDETTLIYQLRKLQERLIG